MYERAGGSKRIDVKLRATPLIVCEPMRPNLRVPRVLWLALLVSVALYGVVVARLPAPEGPPPEPVIPSLVLWIVSAMLVVVSVVVVPWMGRRMQRSAVLASPQRPEQAALAAYQVSLILRLAAADGIAVLGLVNAIVAHRTSDYASSGVLAGLVMLWHFPTRRRALGQ